MPTSLLALQNGLRAGLKLEELWPDLPPDVRRFIKKNWAQFGGRAHQLAPDGDWLTWLILGGRGSGKTRAGAEWVRGIATGNWPYGEPVKGPIALVGETFADAREVMIEGVSGLLSIHRDDERPTWLPSRRMLFWPRTGAIAQTFSSEDPESLRGPQFAAAWADELAKWKNAEATWDMLQFGLRLGPRPRQVVTTTPRPVPLLRRLLDEAGTHVTRMSTRDNLGNLSPAFLSRVVGRYIGTRLGRQELDGELIDDRPDALWRRDEIENLRVRAGDLPPLARIVVAVDPPASRRSGTCGIVAAGIDKAGIGYVIADATVSGARPGEWAARALALWRRLQADALVVEVNQGGDMVAAVIREIDAGVPVREVRATRGKWLRAEPVAALYEQGRVRHAGVFPELEDEMCDFGLDGLSAGRSPDRLDALVWALTALMLDGGGEPRVRGV
jgi:phage terminase large subunit-like protein